MKKPPTVVVNQYCSLFRMPDDRVITPEYIPLSSVPMIELHENYAVVVLQDVLPMAFHTLKDIHGRTLEIVESRCGQRGVYGGRLVIQFTNCQVERVWLEDLIVSSVQEAEATPLNLRMTCGYFIPELEEG